MRCASDQFERVAIWNMVDLKLVGGAFETIANLLPFAHAVNAGRYALTGNYSSILPELVWVAGYAMLVFAAAVLVFMRKMHSDQM